MQKSLKYTLLIGSIAAVLVPTMALAAIVQPTVPVGNSNQAVTAGTVETLINQIVNFLITISVVVAVGFIVWGGLKFITGKPDEGKTILKNGIIGVAIILGVGLILNTVARLVATQSLF